VTNAPPYHDCVKRPRLIGNYNRDTDCLVTIGERLKVIRERKGLGQNELARRSGVSQSMISQIESGQRPEPGVTVVSKLEKGLGLLHGALSAPEGQDDSLERFRRSEYGKDMAVTDDELEMLRAVNWKGPMEEAPPAAWADLLGAIRKRRSRS